MTGPAAVFVSPHQDDEVLTLGAALLTRLRQGREVHVVLFTDGSATGARQLMTQGWKDQFGVAHRVELTPDQLVVARDREFFSACITLGVPPANIYVFRGPAGRVANGEATDEHAHACIRWCEQAFGAAGEPPELLTTSPWDPSPEHAMLGRALADAVAEGRLAAARYGYPQYQLSRKPVDLELTTITLDPGARRVLDRALGEYGVVAEPFGRYQVGYVSVPHAFGDDALRVRLGVNGYAPRHPAAPDTCTRETLLGYEHG